MTAWAATACILAAYAASVRLERPLLFHAANVPGAVVLGFAAASAGLWANAALSAAFGLIGAWALLKRRAS
jgi:hypothetical protein